MKGDFRMTDKEIRKLNRCQLLEILEFLRTKVDELTEENRVLKENLSAHESKVDKILELVQKNNKILSKENLYSTETEQEENEESDKSNQSGELSNGDPISSGSQEDKTQ